MVVVTRRLRTAVAPSERTEYADFPEDKVLNTSYGVVGRPLEDSETEGKIFQESHPDPAITFFKPFSVPYSIHAPAVVPNIRTGATISALTWIFAIAAALFLGFLIYQVAETYPNYSTTVSPLPPVGIFTSEDYQTASSFATLPALPNSLTATNLNLNPILPFPVR